MNKVLDNCVMIFDMRLILASLLILSSILSYKQGKLPILG